MTAGGGEYLSEESVLRPYPLYGSKKRRCCPSSDGFTVITASFAVLTAAITFALVIQIHYGSPEVTPNGAVSTDSDLCSQVGGRIMVEGGTAVDVAIASIFCLSVVHPHVVGPGGGGVMLLHNHKTNASKVIDFMTGVPSKFNIDAVSHDNNIGVPGFLSGLAHAHQHYGKLKWAQLVQPAIGIARNGFSVSANLAKAQDNIHAGHIADLADPFWKTFYRRVTRMKRENYSDFLEKVSKHGLDSLYLDYGTEIIELLHNKSSISVQDLQNYKVKEYPALHMKIKDRSIFTAPAPFGGPQLLAAAQMLFNTKVDISTKESDFYHYIIEAVRKSYPGYLELEDVLNKPPENSTSEYLKEAINSSPLPRDKTAADSSFPTLPPQASSVVTVLDAYDNYVVAVLGLGSEFGSQVMSKHGILYNNHLANIFQHNHASGHNERAHNADTRPLTPYTPFIVTDTRQVCGQRAILGSGEVDAALQVLSQTLFRGANLTQAINRPRIIIRPNKDEIYVHDVGESARPLFGSTKNALESMGHKFTHQDHAEPSINGVSKRKDTVVSWADVRGGGRAFALKVAGTENNVIKSRGVTWSFKDSTTDTSDITHHDVDVHSNVAGHPLLQTSHLTHLSLDNVSLGEYSNSPFISRISSYELKNISGLNDQEPIVPFSSHISVDGLSRIGAVTENSSVHIFPIKATVSDGRSEDSSLGQILNAPSINGAYTDGSSLSQGKNGPFSNGAVINNSNNNEETLVPFADHITGDVYDTDSISNIKYGANTKVDPGILSAGIVPGDSSLIRE